MCSDTLAGYGIGRDEAIRWAAARRDLFPKFPFTEDDLPSGGTHPPTSPTKWEDVELRFLSDHTLQVVLNGKPQAAQNYVEMGFEDRRTETPTKAWETLLDVARADGALKVDRSETGYPKQQKRVQEIRNALRQKFRLTDDPLPLSKGDDTYRARFKATCAPAFDDEDDRH